MTKQSYEKQKNRRLFPKLINKYKETTLTEKAMAYGSILLLFVMMTLNGGGNILWVVLGILSIVLIINLMIYQSKLIFAGLVFAVHVAFLPYAAMLYAILARDGYAGESSGPIVTLSAATFLLTVAAYRFCRGRYWLTLLYVFVALDLAGLLVSISMNFTLGVLPGLVLAIAVIVFRAINWRSVFRKPEGFISRKLVDGSQDDITEKFMKKLGFEVKPLKGTWPLGQVAYSSEGIFLISTFTPSSVIVVNKNRFYYDGAFIEPLLYKLAEEGSKWSESNQIDTKYVRTIALINNKTYYPTTDKMLSIDIKEKGSRKTMGMYLTTQDGVKTIMERDSTYVPVKVLAKVSKEKNIELPN